MGVNPASKKLVIDIGTHAVRAGIIDADLIVEKMSHKDVALDVTNTSYVEQDGMEIVNKTFSVIREVLNAYDLSAELEVALAIQRSTVIAWNAQSGQPLYPAISWQDTRSQALIDGLRKETETIQSQSGLFPSAHYGASKIHWLQQRLRKEKAALGRRFCVGPLVSFVLFHLLDNTPYICDESNASRTMLWNVNQRCWSKELCEIFSVTRESLPEVLPTNHMYGHLKDFGFPLKSVCGDQNAAFNSVSHTISQTCHAQKNSAVVNIGSGAFILMASQANISAGRLLKSLAFSHQRYVNFLLEGTVNSAGTALDVLCQEWIVEQGERPCNRNMFYDNLAEWLRSVLQIPIYVPTDRGFGSPYWRIDTEAGESAITCSKWESGRSTLAQKSVAVLESILFLIYVNIIEMEALGQNIDVLFCSGGGAKINGLLQRLANLTEKETVLVPEVESTLVGAGLFLYENSVGDIGDQNLPKNSKQILPLNTFVPQHDENLKRRFSHFSALMNKRVV